MPKISNYALTMALLTHRVTRSDAVVNTCDGVISSFADVCDYTNFVGSLSADCNVTELFPGADPATEVAELCAYDAPTQFVEIQGTYQKDRRYFAGGGQLVDGDSWAIDSGQIQRFETNLGSSTLIAFPEYAARVQYNTDNENGINGYPANMNLETSCSLKTAMCCFTDDSKGTSFATNGDASTDVCRHDLHDSPQSNHIKEGWSIFPGSETSTHCVGFTWKDGEEELLGNMMYDVSLRNTINKGYLEGVPGSPMCGCVEHMPVVEEAACRTATKTSDITYSFSYSAEEGYVSASNTVGIKYANCDVVDLKSQYVANQGGDAEKVALIDEHLVGSGGCAEEVDNYLNEEHFVQAGVSTRYYTPDTDRWSDLVVGEGINFLPPDLDPAVADSKFRDLINAGCSDSDGQGGKIPRHCIIRRVCASCSSEPHRDIYYKRKNELPTPDDVNFLNMFTDNWVRYENDMEAGDFELYSTYQDALDGTDGWTHCDYGNYDGYGFPRNCGPKGSVWNNWNSYKKYGHGYANHHGFYVEKP